VLLVLFVALRVGASARHPFELAQPEEFLNLRLARQLWAGLPLGDLDRYLYRGIGGPSGAGTLVLSWLYAPLLPLIGAGYGAVRTMATLWALATAVATALLGRELFGPGGALAATVATIALPPAWLLYSLSAYGNYNEAVALVLAAAWLLALVQRRTEDTASAVLVAGIAFLLPFAAWFSPSAALPGVLLLGPTLLAAGRSAGRMGGFAAGAALGSLPALLFGLGASEGSDGFGGQAVTSALARLGDVGDWPRIVFASLGSQSLLEIGEEDPSVWTAGWQVGARRVAVVGAWLGTAALPLLVRRGRSVAGALSVAALLGPIALTLLGAGPDAAGGERVYFYDDRRSCFAYPVWALGGVAAWFAAARLGQRARRLARGGLAALALLGSWIAVVFAVVAGEEKPPGFHPEHWMVCPAEQPAEEAAVCLEALWPESIEPLARLSDDPDLQEPLARRRALRGFSALGREDGEPCWIFDDRRPGRDPIGWTWLGVAAGAGCDPAEVEALCGQAPDRASRAACRGAASGPTP